MRSGALGHQPDQPAPCVELALGRCRESHLAAQSRRSTTGQAPKSADQQLISTNTWGPQDFFQIHFYLSETDFITKVCNKHDTDLFYMPSITNAVLG